MQYFMTHTLTLNGIVSLQKVQIVADTRMQYRKEKTQHI